MTPQISVVMPVYNGEKYLKEAIESILCQTFSEFELIIINDGSKDRTVEIITSFTDKRIVFIDNETNRGLSRSFNIGIKAARGRYIARMDADDISLSHRFMTQKNYLDTHSHISIIGSSITTIDEHGNVKKTLCRPATHELIKWQSLFSTPLFHPTVMAKAEVLKSHLFDEGLHNSEDYELWSRLLFTTDVKFANLKESLLKYRVLSNSFTQTLKTSSRMTSANNTINNIEKYISLTEKRKEALLSLRLNQKLDIKGNLLILVIYFRASSAFMSKERLGLKESILLISSLFSLQIFLFKNNLKRFARAIPLW